MNTDQLLRDLDPAEQPTAAQQQRADALLTRILSEKAAPAAAPRKHRAHPKPLLWGGLATATVAATVAVALVIPGPLPESSPVASWTATALPVDTQDIAVAKDACLTMLEVGGPGVSSSQVAVAERRGDFVALALYQDDPRTMTTCFAAQPPGTDRLENLSSATYAAPPVAPATDSISLAAESVNILNNEVITVITGTVGDDVESITVQGGGYEATATISDGYFMAWLPVATSRSGDWRDAPQVSYGLTLDDGTLREDVATTLPPIDICDLVPADCKGM